MGVLKRKRVFLAISGFAFLFMSVIFLCSAIPAVAQEDILDDLQASEKLKAPNDILEDYYNGETETAVIVLLRPSLKAEELAALSETSGPVPKEFKAPGAPAYYNLQNETIKKQLRTTVTKTVQNAIHTLGPAGITVTQKFSYQFGFAARVTPEALQRIVDLPDVISIEKDYVLEMDLAQGIPLMNATTARSLYSGAGLSIAICDTGIDYTHTKLGGGGFPNTKVIGGYDTGDGDTDPMDGAGHGTCCAGIAAGDVGSVGDYIGGVAPDARLYAVKIATGTTGSASSSAMIAGWEWCVTHQNDDATNPIMIISTSFGGGRYFSTCDSTSSGMTTAAANAVAAGITVFASSGNDGYCDSMGWPACISYVNSIGAVYDADIGTYYPCINGDSCAPTKTATTGCSSGYYATDVTAADMVTSYSNSASFLTLFAPSNSAYTTDIVGSGGYSSGDYESGFGGTSAACPYAAGAAAVLQCAAKARTGSFLTPAEVQTYLTTYGDLITDGKVAITKPRVNLGNAVDALSVEAPVLSAEPAVTPGTENTIYWSAAAAAGSAGTEPATDVQTQPQTTIPKTLISSEPVDKNKGLEPVQLTLDLDSGFVQKVENDKGALDIEAFPAGSTTIFSETFESGFPGGSWALSGDPTWDDTTYDSNNGLYSAWCGASSVNPADGYPNNMNAWMKYGPFSLSDASTASMDFFYNNDSESGYDYFIWAVSTDGTNYSGYQVSGDSGGWTSQTYDLADKAGEPQVWVAFIFQSDEIFGGDNGFMGAFVDDVVISKDVITDPNLVPYQPAGWSDEIVVSTGTGTNEDSSPLYTTDTLYVDWAVINNGAAPTAATFYTELYVDDVLQYTWMTSSPLTVDNYAYVEDYSIGSLSAGTHTIKIKTDSTNAITEDNETDNEYTKTITVSIKEYYAECSDDDAFTSPTNSGWTTQEQWTFTSLTPGQTYWYRVKARVNGSESDWSNVEYSQQEALAAYQIVRSETDPIACSANSQFVLPVEYDTSDGNNQTSGIGIRVYFDGSKMDWVGYDDVFTGATNDLTPLDDTGDDDGDPSTTKYLGLAWYDINGQWPGTSLPLRLTDMRFQSKNMVDGDSTQINFGVTAKDAAYEFQGISATVVIQSCCLDIDGNGAGDALTDGILVIRYLFGFTGDTLINGAIGSGATRTTAAEIEAYLSNCESCCLDIDGNGTADALTDGIIVIRYLFGFTGDTLINGAIGSGATRTTAAEIEAYLAGLVCW